MKANKIELHCPECGSTEIIKASKVVRARQFVQRFRCKKCLRLFVPPPVVPESQAKKQQA